MQSEQAETLKRLAALISEKNKQHNLTSAKTATELYENHINDCVQAFQKTQKNTLFRGGRKNTFTLKKFFSPLIKIFIIIIVVINIFYYN